MKRRTSKRRSRSHASRRASAGGSWTVPNPPIAPSTSPGPPLPLDLVSARDPGHGRQLEPEPRATAAGRAPDRIIAGSSGSCVGERRGSRRIRASARRFATSACPVGAIAPSPRCRRPAGKVRAALRLRNWSARWRVTHLACRPLASAALPRWDTLALPHPFPVQGAGATSCR
jgi:hypothetical protein